MSQFPLLSCPCRAQQAAASSSCLSLYTSFLLIFGHFSSSQVSVLWGSGQKILGGMWEGELGELLHLCLDISKSTSPAAMVS